MGESVRRVSAGLYTGSIGTGRGTWVDGAALGCGLGQQVNDSGPDRVHVFRVGRGLGSFRLSEQSVLVLTHRARRWFLGINDG